MTAAAPSTPGMESYTAWRLGCDVDTLPQPGTHVVVARTGVHPWLCEPYAATRPEVLCLFRRGETAIARIHEEPTPAVQAIVGNLPPERPVEAEDIAALESVSIEPYNPDPYFSLDATTFAPVPSEGIRRLTHDDAPAMDALHAAIDPRIRWYVEIDHPVVFGFFLDGQLVSAASHFLFEDFKVAVPGVVTHPDFRRRGLEATVVSAAVAWALHGHWIVEWSTNASNLASLGLAKKLGFRDFAIETEFRIGSAESE